MAAELQEREDLLGGKAVEGSALYNRKPESRETGGRVCAGPGRVCVELGRGRAGLKEGVVSESAVQ